MLGITRKAGQSITIVVDGRALVVLIDRVSRYGNVSLHISGDNAFAVMRTEMSQAAKDQIITVASTHLGNDVNAVYADRRYDPAMGDMKGWRFLRVGEDRKDAEVWSEIDQAWYSAIYSASYATHPKLNTHHAPHRIAIDTTIATTSEETDQESPCFKRNPAPEGCESCPGCPDCLTTEQPTST